MHAVNYILAHLPLTFQFENSRNLDAATSNGDPSELDDLKGLVEDKYTVAAPLLSKTNYGVRNRRTRQYVYGWLRLCPATDTLPAQLKCKLLMLQLPSQMPNSVFFDAVDNFSVHMGRNVWSDHKERNQKSDEPVAKKIKTTKKAASEQPKLEPALVYDESEIKVEEWEVDHQQMYALARIDWPPPLPDWFTQTLRHINRRMQEKIWFHREVAASVAFITTATPWPMAHGLLMIGERQDQTSDTI